jgi:hypothetical protein
MIYSRFAAIVAIAAGLTLLAPISAAAQSTPAQIAKAAPADEYFGPLGLSVIGIQNSLTHAAIRLDRIGQGDGDALHSVGLVEKSIRDWETRYPGDVWLPKTVLALHRVYRRIASQAAEERAMDCAAWLLAKYPDSGEARTLRAELAGELGPVAEETVTASNR